MLDLSDMGEEDVSRAVSSEFKRIVEDDVDLPFLVDSLVVDGRALQVVGPNEVLSMMIQYYPVRGKLPKLVLGLNLAILQSIFKDDDLRDKFCELSDRCPTVVACRLSPIQVNSSEEVSWLAQMHATSNKICRRASWCGW